MKSIKKMRNRKGKGYIFKRNGTYYVRIKVGGKDIAQSLHTREERVAKERWHDFVQSIVRKGKTFDMSASLALLKAQIETERNRNVAKTEKIKIKDMFSIYLDSPFHNPITYNVQINYRAMSSHFVRWYKRSPYMCDVSKEDVVRFVTAMNKGIVRKERLFAMVCCLRRIWQACMKYDNNIKSNVWEYADVSYKRDHSHKRRELSDDEINRLFIASDRPEFQKYWNGEVRILFELGAMTGLRLMDCVSLRWNEIGEQIIKRIPRKTQSEGTEAVIPICDSLRFCLDAWKKSGKSTDDYVLPILSSIHRRKINKIVSRVFRAAGIVITEIDKDGKRRIRTGFHSLRVAALSRFLRICHDINIVKTIAAHKHADMTLWYARCRESDVVDAFFKKDTPVSLSAETSRQIAALKNAGETADDFIRRLLSKSLPNNTASVMEIAS